MSVKLDHLPFIENHIQKIEFPETPENLYEPLRYFLGLGGKRIRPILTLLSAEMFGVSKEKSVDAGLAIELFHNFTLIHDDIMDMAPQRRNLPTVHEKWNINIGILTGDVLLMHALELLNSYSESQYNKLSKLLIRTSIEVCIGQQMDMDFEQKNKVTETEYLEMIRLKTSVLIGCACAFGAILGEKESSIINSMYNFGVNLGIAFQIQDDVLDAFGDPLKFGKQVGGDILSDKKTLLVTTFESVANASQINEYQKIRENSKGDDKIEKIKKLFVESNVLSICQSSVLQHHKLAKEELSKLSLEYNTSSLENLLSNLLDRTY